jgi:hypothetical protein
MYVDFFERTFVQQDVEPFAGGQLALGVLGVDPALAAAEAGGGAALFHFGDIGGHAPASGTLVDEVHAQSHPSGAEVNRF